MGSVSSSGYLRVAMACVRLDELVAYSGVRR